MSGPTEVNLTVNTTVSITVTAEDPNGDPMTFNVTGSLPKGAQLSTNASSVTLTWNVTTQQVNNQNRSGTNEIQGDIKIHNNGASMNLNPSCCIRSVVDRFYEPYFTVRSAFYTLGWDVVLSTEQASVAEWFRALVL